MGPADLQPTSGLGKTQSILFISVLVLDQVMSEFYLEQHNHFFTWPNSASPTSSSLQLHLKLLTVHFPHARFYAKCWWEKGGTQGWRRPRPCPQGVGKLVEEWHRHIIPIKCGWLQKGHQRSREGWEIQQRRWLMLHLNWVLGMSGISTGGRVGRACLAWRSSGNITQQSHQAWSDSKLSQSSSAIALGAWGSETQVLSVGDKAMTELNIKMMASMHWVCNMCQPLF